MNVIEFYQIITNFNFKLLGKVTRQIFIFLTNPFTQNLLSLKCTLNTVLSFYIVLKFNYKFGDSKN